MKAIPDLVTDLGQLARECNKLYPAEAETLINGVAQMGVEMFRFIRQVSTVAPERRPGWLNTSRHGNKAREALAALHAKQEELAPLFAKQGLECPDLAEQLFSAWAPEAGGYHSWVAQQAQ